MGDQKIQNNQITTLEVEKKSTVWNLFFNTYL